MKYEVIGWLSAKNNSYPDFLKKEFNEFELKDWNDYYSARLAVVNDVKKNGYCFGGYSHQNRAGCAPVLNNGTIIRFDSKEWGAIMAEAWNIPNDDGFAYSAFAFGDHDISQDDRTKNISLKYPKSNVNKKRIVQGVQFEAEFPEGYDPYGTYPKNYTEPAKELADFINSNNVKIMPSRENETVHPMVFEMTLNDEPFQLIYDGKKTVEVRLYDDKRQKIEVGDIIQFLRKDHFEDHMRTEVVALYRFSSFLELFSSDLFSKTESEVYTAEEAAKKMYEYYTEADENKYGVLAIEIKVLTK